MGRPTFEIHIYGRRVPLLRMCAYHMYGQQQCTLLCALGGFTKTYICIYDTSSLLALHDTAAVQQ